MIIESGYDLFSFMFPREPADDWSVVVVTLDSELRPVRIATIADRYAGSLEAHRDDILALIDDDTAHLCVGHRVADTAPHQDLSAFFDSSGIAEEVEARGVNFLGHQVHDSEYWQSSGPMYTFEHYLGSETIPRVLVIPPPHPFLDCACQYCGPRNQRREEALREAQDHPSD